MKQNAYDTSMYWAHRALFHCLEAQIISLNRRSEARRFHLRVKGCRFTKWFIDKSRIIAEIGYPRRKLLHIRSLPLWVILDLFCMRYWGNMGGQETLKILNVDIIPPSLPLLSDQGRVDIGRERIDDRRNAQMYRDTHDNLNSCIRPPSLNVLGEDPNSYSQSQSKIRQGVKRETEEEVQHCHWGSQYFLEIKQRTSAPARAVGAGLVKPGLLRARPSRGVTHTPFIGRRHGTISHY